MRLDVIGYDGTDFSGWARQPGLRTVCGVLEEALSTVLREPVDTDRRRTHRRGRARDRAGRALRRQRSSFGLDRRARSWFADWRRFLPHRRADQGHRSGRRSSSTPGSRRSADTTNTGSAPRPVRRRTVAGARRGLGAADLDLDAMNAASAALLGLHDFAAFCSRTEGATTVRELQRFDWVRDGDLAHRPRQRRRLLLVDGPQPGRRDAAVGEGRRSVEWTAGCWRSASARVRSRSRPRTG